MASRSKTPSYLAEPTIHYLLQVLEQLHSGEIQLPRFQRFDVWKPEQRRELLRSIHEGIPIGTIMIWRTRQRVNVEHRIGLHELPHPREKGPRQYVLDGVQRLSTLYQALFPPTLGTAADDGETNDDFTVYYDLREQDFFPRSDLDDATPAPHHVPLTTLRDSVSLLKFLRRLTSPDAEIQDAETLTERADALASAFRAYKVPVVPLASDDLAFATKTFQRINTQGTPMSEVHMVNALVYQKGFDLIERIREARQERFTPVGWAELEDETVLRTIKALLGIDVYATQADATRDVLRRRPEAVEEAIEALVRTAAFARKDLDVRSPLLVPYGTQIVLLAKTLHDTPEPSREGRAALKDWVTLTTYTELFASNMSAARFDALARELRGAARGEPLVWSVRRPLTRRDLPPNFDFRHARAKLLALRMARVRAPHDSAAGVDLLESLALGGVKGVPQLVTHKMAASGAWMRSPGARVVTTDTGLAEVRRILQSPDTDSATLDSYLIPRAVHRLLTERRYEEAVRKREEYLNDLERQDFRELLDRHTTLRDAAQRSVGLAPRATGVAGSAVPKRRVRPRRGKGTAPKRRR